MTETTKPVVTQADRNAAADLLSTPGSSYIGIQAMNAVADRIRRGIYDEHPWVQAFAAHRLASQAVVSQDLVERLRHNLEGAKNLGYSAQSTLEAILPIIEAAQIAARNEALEEAAKVFTDYQQRVKDGGSDTTVMWTAERAAYAIRALRTPSQHQESEAG